MCLCLINESPRLEGRIKKQTYRSSLSKRRQYLQIQGSVTPILLCSPEIESLYPYDKRLAWIQKS